MGLYETRVPERNIWISGVLAAIFFALGQWDIVKLWMLWDCLAGLFALLFLKNTITQMWLQWVDGYAIYRSAQSTTPASKYNETLGGLGSEGLQRLANGFLTIQLDMSPDFSRQSPTIYIRTTRIPIWFFLEYMSLSTHDGVPSMDKFIGINRDYKRELAGELTNYLASKGMVNKFEGGNRPASWRTGLHRTRILEAFGFTEDYLGYYKLGETIFNFTIKEQKRSIESNKLYEVEKDE